MTIYNNNNSIICNNNKILKSLNKNSDYYFEKTTLIFGRTNSGKTTIVNEIMYLCKDLITTCFVLSPSNTSNNNFTNIIPDECIFTKLEDNWLSQLWIRQTHASEIYSIVNNIENLLPLFNMIANKYEIETYNKINKLLNIYEEQINLLNNNINKNKQLQEVKETRKYYLIKFFKDVIRKNINKLRKKKLNIDQESVIDYLDFNPNIMIIFDDCASNFKKWYKKNNTIKDLFYEGRHKHITTIITAQDDKEIDSELRKNALVTIFTTEESAISNFTRPSNSFSKSTINEAQIFTKELFQSKISHAKLVYIKNYVDSPFRYIIANIYPPFKMGCSPLWNFVNIIKKSCDDTIKKNNIFINKVINKKKKTIKL